MKNLEYGVQMLDPEYQAKRTTKTFHFTNKRVSKKVAITITATNSQFKELGNKPSLNDLVVFVNSHNVEMDINEN